ncbi:unnamed protein product [Spodoptera littoralis]|uniref:Uncharacterized protein n=1 Tax=Spodoptera littoralis TaxID=7109 RepID=A0A9P0IAW9_SPOLI|nr:unnamed protein product [Spodoptera littoralis]CAH1643348.1 unnamed protein product [Spodoptera littoralis]
MPNFNPFSLKLTKLHTNFHPLFYPLGGINNQNPFLGDTYVITSVCVSNFNPIGAKPTKFHTNFYPLFYPLGDGNDQNPFLAYVITSTCMPNFSPIRPIVW